MKSIGYLQCQKSGYHSGQYLNIICLQSVCKNNMLCCCACIQEFHQNHKTKTLKKLIMDSDIILKNYKKPVKIQQNITQTYNTDIMINMVQNYQKIAINKIKQLKQKFFTQINQLQTNVKNYYETLNNDIKNSHYQNDKDIYTSLIQNMQLVQGSNTLMTLNKNVSNLLSTLQKFQRINSSQIQIQKPDQQSYLNFLKNSNVQVNEIIQKKFQDLYDKLKQQNDKMKKIIPKLSTFWHNQLYKFSDKMHHQYIQVINPFLVRSNIDSIYQISLMNPHLSFINQVQTFRFRINVCDLQWVAVGVAYKNIVQKANYQFNFNELGHGGYLISGNGGTWSHSQIEFNNAVKSFYFKQGDSVTCVVYKDRICFIKDIPPEHEFSEEYSQRQYFQLAIKPENSDKLHPCVVSFYKNTQIQYLPSFSSQLRDIDMPVFKYKFSKFKHENLTLLNSSHLYGQQPTQYKCCVLDNHIQDNGPFEELKSVTFRITRSTGGWIALGLGHKQKIKSKKYSFNFEDLYHGCYLISSNGGSWSNIDQQANNIVRAFKFIEGDLITCTLDQVNKKIIFKRSVDTYQLVYLPQPNDKLYPVVVLYYPQDQIQVLPVF